MFRASASLANYKLCTDQQGLQYRATESYPQHAVGLARSSPWLNVRGQLRASPFRLWLWPNASRSNVGAAASRDTEGRGPHLAAQGSAALQAQERGRGQVGNEGPRPPTWGRPLPESEAT